MSKFSRARTSQGNKTRDPGRFIFPDSYPNPHLLIDYLNKYFTLKLLDDRRSDLTEQLTTMKILGEEVRVFLNDCFFVGIVFTDN